MFPFSLSYLSNANSKDSSSEKKKEASDPASNAAASEIASFAAEATYGDTLRQSRVPEWHKSSEIVRVRSHLPRLQHRRSGHDVNFWRSQETLSIETLIMKIGVGPDENQGVRG